MFSLNINKKNVASKPAPLSLFGSSSVAATTALTTKTVSSSSKFHFFNIFRFN